ncbi:MAG TPA: shikimate dehydrogenase [Solirubrobacteraceae bacterium]|nr:shikimate dehydrogenase [Solirubrobacteraceae bacterium]
MHRLGVLGWPVAHSRSPAMHTAALCELGLADGWTYQHLPVPVELFAETVGALPAAGFVGANVTVPHKEAALALAHEATAAAQAIGAANTLTFSAAGAIHADNTDAPGLLAALPADPRGATALVLGAGGSARAAIHALREAGAGRVLVWNRTPERAHALARELGAHAVEPPLPAFDVLVHCTTSGLRPGSDQLKDLPPLADHLSIGTFVVDLVYTEHETPLTALARERGAAVADGLEVLVHQGALSLQRWTGRPAPLAAMRAAAHGRGGR